MRARTHAAADDADDRVTGALYELFTVTRMMEGADIVADDAIADDDHRPGGFFVDGRRRRRPDQPVTPHCRHLCRRRRQAPARRNDDLFPRDPWGETVSRRSGRGSFRRRRHCRCRLRC